MAFRTVAGHLSKHIATIVGIALVLIPVGAFAGSQSLSSTCLTGIVCIDNETGMATGGASGLVMDGSNGSVASIVTQIGTMQGANLGSLTLTTGALLSGTLSGGGTFADGTLAITTTGWNGFSGTLFSGTFGNSAAGTPIQWTYMGKVGSGSSAYYEYELSGPINGSWENGAYTVSGQTAQLYFHSKSLYTGGSISLANGSTSVVVPEPGTVGLMGTGLIGLGLFVRRKVKQLQTHS